jgi:hypothetical protein
MKKLLLAAALCALAAPAYAAKPVPAPAPPAGVTCIDGFCDGQADDSEELKMDADVANKAVSIFFGSVHGNGQSQFTPDITVTTKTGLMQWVDTDSGYGEIKPVKDGVLTDLLFTVNGTAVNVKTGDKVTNLFDGFFTRAQVIGPTTDSQVLVDLLINGKDLFKFSITPNDRDFATIGVDELTDATANLLTSAELFIDPLNSAYTFKSVKQIDWSPCAAGECVGINQTGTAPEPSTWVMMAAGFGLMGLFGWRKHKIARYAV